MKPARLHKQVAPEEEIEAWILAHAHIFLPVCFIILLLLCIWLCFAFVGASATDSGLTYNHLMDVI